MRPLIVCKCRAVFWGHAAEKSAAGVMSASVRSELLSYTPRRGASIKAPSADERNTTEEDA